MSATGLSMVAGTIGPTGFAALVWGAIVLVAIAFVYIVRSVYTEWRRN